MLNEFKSKTIEKRDKKSLKNEEVRVGDVKLFEEIMKKCRKESFMAGRRIWKIENSVKERIFLKICYGKIERNEEKGGLIEENIKS